MHHFFSSTRFSWKDLSGKINVKSFHEVRVSCITTVESICGTDEVDLYLKLLWIITLTRINVE